MTINDDILDYAMRMRCQEVHMVTDHETGLKGLVAIHNTNLGPALGGCRWLEYSTTQQAAVDAIRLAQGMSFKSAVAGLNLGGGKAVLLKSGQQQLNKVAYFSAFAKFLNTLNGRYITAVDSGTSVKEMDIISTTTKHVTSTSKCKYANPDPSIATAHGVLSGILAAVDFKLNKSSLAGVHVAVQGLGHVGHELVRLLHKEKAQITVFDVNPGAVKTCVDEFGVGVANNAEEILRMHCDVLAPCALGAILNQDSIPRINARIIAGAANNQLEYAEEDAQRLIDNDILYAPDFVINAGGVIFVANEHAGVSEAANNAKIVAIGQTLHNIFKRARDEGRTTHAIAQTIALERIYAK